MSLDKDINIKDFKISDIDLDYDKVYLIFQEWKLQKPSEKQINLIKQLSSDYDTNNLTKYEAINLIEDLHKKKLINEDQINVLKNNISIEEINKQLKINLLNYNKIIKGINFSFKNIVNGYIPKRLNLPLIISSNYEIGISQERSDLNTYIYYMKFYDIMVLDYDNINYEELINRLKIFKDKFLFRIYKTHNGYHVFIISHYISYNSNEMILISNDLKCDPWYTIYCKYHGYCIRISPKNGRNEEYTHKFITNYGLGDINFEIMKYINLFDNKILPIYDNVYEPIFFDVDFNQNFRNGYFNDFLKIVNKYSISLYKNGFFSITPIEKEINKLLNNIDFRRLLIEKMDKNIQLIKYLTYYLSKSIRTAYRCIHNEKDYFIGVDMNVNMYCIYYKDILVFDIDFNESIKDDDEHHTHVNNILKENKFMLKCKQMSKKYGDTYMVYRTRNGFHVFVVNKRFDNTDISTVKYMLDFGVDINYIIFSYLVGYVVRLNRKKINDNMYKYIETIGNNIDPSISSIVSLHNDCSKMYLYQQTTY